MDGLWQFMALLYQHDWLKHGFSWDFHRSSQICAHISTLDGSLGNLGWASECVLWHLGDPCDLFSGRLELGSLSQNFKMVELHIQPIQDGLFFKLYPDISRCYADLCAICGSDAGFLRESSTQISSTIEGIRLNGMMKPTLLFEAGVSIWK